MNKIKTNKYLYGWRFSVNYGQGYEYECFELTYKEMRAQRKAYLENCNYPLRISKGRELNPNYKEPRQ